jgi:hypothetical protein
MADDTPFANGAGGPAPRSRRKMYASPFGALSNDSPPIQYGTGPTPQLPTNSLAVRPIAQPFGMLQGAPLDNSPGPAPPQQGGFDPAMGGGINTLAAPPPAPAPQPIAAPFGGLQGAPLDYSPPPENTEDDGLDLARRLGLPDPRLKVPTPYNPAPYDDTPAATQSAAPVDSIKALMQTVRRRF